MKRLKQLFICLSAFILCAGFVLVGSMKAEAATKDVPSKVHAYTGTQGYLWFSFDSEGSKITDLKSNSKNLKAKLVSLSEDSCEISYYAKKNGSYKITFTIKPKSGKSIKKTVKVVADKVYPIKKITFGGKKIPMYTYWNDRTLYTTANSGKLSVSMNKGYKLKKIRIGTQKKIKSGSSTYTDITYKTVKNNKKITLGNVYKTMESSSMYDNLCSKFAEIEIQYTSPYSKNVESDYVYIYKM